MLMLLSQSAEYRPQAPASKRGTNDMGIMVAHAMQVVMPALGMTVQ